MPTDQHLADRPAADGSAVRARLTLGSGPRGGGEGGFRQRLAVLLVGLLIVALAACGYLGWDRWRRPDPASSGAITAAGARDKAYDGSVAAVETLLSADYEHAAASVRRWSDVTTGRLHARLSTERAALVRQLERNEEVTTAEVLDSGLASWDVTGGTARLLATIRLTTNAGGEDERETKVRYLVMAQRVGDDWRLSAVQQIGEIS